MIEVSGLTKLYGKKKAVDSISFTVGEGEVVGFLGPNGAGKSTTMNMITGYLSATEGSIKVGGLDVLDDAALVRRKIGYLPEQPPLYMDMTVDEYLDFAYDLKKASQPRSAHLAEVCKMVGLESVRKRVIGNLSKGYKQRVGLAQALIGNPEVLILDEPTVGLDPIQIIEIRNMIKELGKERTVILSSHILPEVQAICERVLVISNGVIVADDTPEHLSSLLSGEHRLALRIAGEKEKVLDILSGLPSVQRVEVGAERELGVFDYTVESAVGSDIRRGLFFALAEAQCPIYMMKPLDLSLEDIFLKLTADGDTASPAQTEGAAAGSPIPEQPSVTPPPESAETPAAADTPVEEKAALEKEESAQ